MRSWTIATAPSSSVPRRFFVAEKVPDWAGVVRRIVG